MARVDLGIPLLSCHVFCRCRPRIAVDELSLLTVTRWRVAMRTDIGRGTKSYGHEHHEQAHNDLCDAQTSVESIPVRFPI